jgi:FdhD protein
MELTTHFIPACVFTAENGPDQPGAIFTSIQRVNATEVKEAEDQLAIEEPLEIRIEFGPAHLRTTQSISITMRTPGYDFELAVGFLFTEGLIRSRCKISSLLWP